MFTPKNVYITAVACLYELQRVHLRWEAEGIFLTADREIHREHLFMIISDLQTSCHTPDVIQPAHHLFNLLLICTVLPVYFCSLLLLLFSMTYVVVYIGFSAQDQTSQSTDPSRTNPSRPPLSCTANTPLQTPHTALLQTPDSELQTGPVLVE